VRSRTEPGDRIGAVAAGHGTGRQRAVAEIDHTHEDARRRRPARAGPDRACHPRGPAGRRECRVDDVRGVRRHRHLGSRREVGQGDVVVPLTGVRTGGVEEPHPPVAQADIAQEAPVGARSQAPHRSGPCIDCDGPRPADRVAGAGLRDDASEAEPVAANAAAGLVEHVDRAVRCHGHTVSARRLPTCQDGALLVEHLHHIGLARSSERGVEATRGVDVEVPQAVQRAQRERAEQLAAAGVPVDGRQVPDVHTIGAVVHREGVGVRLGDQEAAVCAAGPVDPEHPGLAEDLAVEPVAFLFVRRHVPGAPVLGGADVLGVAHWRGPLQDAVGTRPTQLAGADQADDTHRHDVAGQVGFNVHGIGGGELGFERAVEAEPGHHVVPSVGDQHVAGVVNRDGVRRIELARSLTGDAPLVEEHRPGRKRHLHRCGL